jgi:predicted dinucleotide-binding enzyme
MRLGILGAATVGITLATKFAAKHQVLLANSRGPETLPEVGDGVSPAAASEALACDVVFLCVPWRKVADVLTPAVSWEGRILVDTTNIFLSYAPDYRIDDLEGESGSEAVAKLAPSARVVKAFNTLGFETMFAPVPADMKRVLFVAGDDGEAVSTVCTLISELGLHPVALGALAVAGRQMELGGPLSGLELLTARTEGPPGA